MNIHKNAKDNNRKIRLIMDKLGIEDEGVKQE